MDYPNATEADLAETVRLVEAQDRRMIGLQADARDFAELRKAFDEGFGELGRLDIIITPASTGSRRRRATGSSRSGATSSRST